MSEKTGISWCDATFNPWWGCVKVSPGCDHCYAERDAARFSPGQTLWGVGSARRTFGDKHWNQPLRWARTLPAKLGRRPRVFCASMADVFDKDAPPGERARLFALIEATPELDWLILTKRIGNAERMIAEAVAEVHGVYDRDNRPPNIWLGISVVNQEEADRDIPKLLEIPAEVHWLSIEPMLGPVDLRTHQGQHGREGFAWAVDWVVVGGESGPEARPMSALWEFAVREQCIAAGIPYHFKQWGEWAPLEVCANAEAPWTPCGIDRTHVWLGADGRTEETAFRIGRKAAGNKVYPLDRMSDGRTFQEFPHG